jgi:hypothetical protein
VQYAFYGLRSLNALSLLFTRISTKAAAARDPDLEWMVRMFVERGGGYAGVDATIRAALRSAMVIPAHGGALVVAAGKAMLRSIVLTQEQGALVHRIFYDDASGRWRRGRWHVEAGASSGKSYIAMHLSAHWATAADGGATLYLCHHARQQGVVKQIACELRSVLGEGASVVAEECVGVRGARVAPAVPASSCSTAGAGSVAPMPATAAATVTGERCAAALRGVVVLGGRGRAHGRAHGAERGSLHPQRVHFGGEVECDVAETERRLAFVDCVELQPRVALQAISCASETS